MSKALQKESISEGSLWDKIISFALPLAATGILQQLFNAADVAVVGRCTGKLGEAAMAAVGANTPIIGLIVNTFMAIALGSNVVIANAVGRGDTKAARRTVHTSVLLALIGGVLIAIGAECLSGRILSSQHLPDEVLPMALSYFRVYMTGLPLIMLYNFEAAIFRAVGDTKTPLIVLMFSGVLNVGLNLLFVLCLHRTADGVAAATVISNALSAVILCFRLMKGNDYVRLSFSALRIDVRILKRILAIGIPAGMQSAVFSTANILIQSTINKLGTVVIAASSAAFNLEVFSYTTLNSFSQACTTFVGQNYGAGKIDRCKRSALLAMGEGCVALGLSIGVILLLGRRILFIFNPAPDVIEVGYQRLIIIFSAYFFTLSYEVLSGYLRGFGISLIPALITMLFICGTRIGWIYLIFPKDPTFKNIMVVYPVSLSVTAVAMLLAVIVLRPAKKHEKLLSKDVKSA